MAKRKTLVKNKRKKRQTKKRYPKKYIGGDINEILKILETESPILKKKIENCLRPGAICYTNIFPIIRNEHSLDDNKRRELTVLIGDIVQKNADLRKKVEQELEEQERETDAERGAIEKLEGKPDTWLEIKDMLSRKFVMRQDIGFFKQYEGQNKTNQNNAQAIIDSSVRLLQNFENDKDYQIKLEEFIELLFNFSAHNSVTFTSIKQDGLQKCLEYHKKLVELKSDKIKAHIYFLKSLIKYLHLLNLNHLIEVAIKVTDYVKKCYVSQDPSIISIIMKNESVGLKNLLVTYCNHIINNIDYSFQNDRKISGLFSNTGWRTSIMECIEELVSILEHYRGVNCSINETISKVKQILMHKICTIVFIKKQTYSGLATEKCEKSTKNTEDYKDFDTIVNDRFNTILKR
jgi:hypothetical protein